MDALADIPDPRALTRVRYETRLRQLTVTQVQALSPHLIRIRLSGDFEAFHSLSFDDHVKLFFPDPETGVLTLPVPGAAPAAGGPKPIMRDYTPRSFDVAAQTLDIEFALHGADGDAGPATRWAIGAKPGDILHLGGPRGSTLIPLAFDGYVLIGDDTALPAIGRRLAELPAGVPVTVLAEVETPEDHIAFETKADVTIHWVHRQTSCLNQALKGLHLPQTDIHVWVACEAAQAKLIRQQLIDDHGVKLQWLKASGYWHKGEAGAEKTTEA